MMHWAYVNGEVAFDSDWGRAAHTAATSAGYDPQEASRLSNMVSRKQLPTESDVAVGSLVMLRGSLRPQIWLSTTDRNHVMTTVIDAMMRDQAPSTPLAGSMGAEGLSDPSQGMVERSGRTLHTLTDEHGPRAGAPESDLDLWMRAAGVVLPSTGYTEDVNSVQDEATIREDRTVREAAAAWTEKWKGIPLSNKRQANQLRHEWENRPFNTRRVNTYVGDQKAGYANVSVREAYKATRRDGRVDEYPKTATIDMIEVHPDHRRTGVASAMMDEIRAQYEPEHEVKAGGFKLHDGHQFFRQYEQGKYASDGKPDDWEIVKEGGWSVIAKKRATKYKAHSHVSKRDYMRAVKEHGPVPAHHKPKQSAVDPEWWAEHVAQNPYSYHTHTGDAADAIEQNGLLPYGQLDPYIRDRGYGGVGNHPRWNHAYAAVSDSTYNPGDLGQRGQYTVFRIDNSQLDPALIDLDEDFANPNHGYVGIPQLKNQVNGNHEHECPCGKEAAGGYTGNSKRTCNGGVGGWVDSNPHMDEHENVIKGIQHGRGAFAVRGGIPAHALERHDEGDGECQDYEHETAASSEPELLIHETAGLIKFVDELRTSPHTFSQSEEAHDYNESECIAYYEAGQSIDVHKDLFKDILADIAEGMEPDMLLEVLKGLVLIGDGTVGDGHHGIPNGEEVMLDVMNGLTEMTGIHPDQEQLFNPGVFTDPNAHHPIDHDSKIKLVHSALGFLRRASKAAPGNIILPHPYDSDTYNATIGPAIDTFFAPFLYGQSHVQNGQEVMHKGSGAIGTVTDAQYNEGTGWHHSVNWEKSTVHPKQDAALAKHFAILNPTNPDGYQSNGHHHWSINQKKHHAKELKPIGFKRGEKVMVDTGGSVSRPGTIDSVDSGWYGKKYHVDLGGEEGIVSVSYHDISPRDPELHDMVSEDDINRLSSWDVDHQATLDANRGRDLDGLPSRPVHVRGSGHLQFGSHGHVQQVAEQYNAERGHGQHPTDYMKVRPDISKKIADEYEQMPHDPDHPAVKEAYDALKGEVLDQYHHAVKNGYQFDFYPEEDPYPNSPREAVLDVHHNSRMYVYPTEAGYGGPDDDTPRDHPLLERIPGVEWSGKPVTYNDAFRAIHDYYGHIKEGLGFRADGEDNAYRQHAAMFSPMAQRALTSETRGQNSWVNYGPHGEHNQTATADTIYAPQKAGLLPQWVSDPNLHAPVTAEPSTYASTWQEIT